uniref:Thioredoxin domain-containing protein n=1 Tax=Compsopogon caeruleus TaxID=31354 RepID=A0A7S1TFB3_9RHOD|mmetsp:Transcript_4458/g.8852  ORF Transcript_4458/g.8852 Transcript_4458/m.8852 type:complete len:370 (+) Transcript_4458:58-1167(+)
MMKVSKLFGKVGRERVVPVEEEESNPLEFKVVRVRDGVGPYPTGDEDYACSDEDEGGCPAASSTASMEALELEGVMETGLGDGDEVGKAVDGKGLDRGFVVVELFTSDGCRACRSVDDILVKATRTKGKGVVDGESGGGGQVAWMKGVQILQFHSNYFDNDSFKDPFGASAFRERQEMYAQLFKCESFTPMAVVNGRTAIIATNALALRLAISAARRRAVAIQDPRPMVNLGLTLSRDEDGEDRFYLTVATRNLLARGLLNLAVVQDELGASIPLGGNKHKQTRHDGVVRGFLAFEVPEGDSVETIPILFTFRNIRLERMKIVGYLGSHSDPRVLAAASVSFCDALVSFSDEDNRLEPTSPIAASLSSV